MNPTDDHVRGDSDLRDSASGVVLADLVIVIDPGHNGRNGEHTSELQRFVDAGGFMKACNTTGASAGEYTEAQFNWDFAQRLRDLIEQAGAAVIMTRENNEGWGPCIDERGLTAQRNGADLLVSLHADGAAPSRGGFHVIYPTRIKGYTDATSEPSHRFAEMLRDNLVLAGFTASDYAGTAGVVARGDLGTLNRAGAPAVILEAGNMRNSGDLAMLRSADGQERLATAVVNAVRVWARDR